MAFKDMKPAELRTVAEEFGVDLEGAKNKAEIIAALTEEGVTFEEYQRVANLERADVEEAVKEEPIKAAGRPQKHDPTGDEVLLRMRRDNWRFEAYGTVFTKEHPFAVVDRETANNIFEHFEGFTSATPKELEDYYS